MKRYFAGLLYLCILVALPIAAGTSRIYVMNVAGSSVSIIDPASNKVVQTIEGLELPLGAIFAPDGSRAYVSEQSESVIAVVDGKTGEVIKKIPTSGRPTLPAITPDGKRLYVCISEKPPLAGVDVIDTTTFKLIKTLPMPSRMHDCYTSQDGKYGVFGSDADEGYLTVVDLKTDQTAWQMRIGETGVRTMTIDNGGPGGSANRIFVQLGGLDGFAVVDFAKHAEVSRIKFPEIEGPSFMAATRDPSHGAVIPPDGKTFWVNSTLSNTVFIYSLPDLKLLGHVRLPELKIPGKDSMSGAPHWITSTMDSKTIYVVNTALATVSAIDAKTMKLVANIPVGEGARELGTLP